MQQWIRKAKERNQKYKELISQLKNEEDRVKKQKHRNNWILKIQKLQHEINKLLREEMAKRIKLIKQEF